MSRIKNGDLHNQWHDSCSKVAQESSKQTAISIEQMDFRYLSVENYMNIEKKSKQQIFNSQLSYFSQLKLIASTFHVCFDNFFFSNYHNFQLNSSITLSSISSNHALQSILGYNKTKDFLTSYTGFTRKTTNSLFLLINHYQQTTKTQNSNNNHKVKIIFLNTQGRILHVCSNLDYQNIDKVNKIIKKHFSCLDMIVVLNKNSPLQQAEQIVKILEQKNEKIFMVILLPSKKTNIQTVESVETLIKSNKLTADRFQPNKLNSGNARGIQDLNINVINLLQGDLEIELIENLVERVIQMSKIEEFVFQKMIKREIISLEMGYKNEWIISVASLIFNIMTSGRRNILQSVDEVSARQQVQSKLSRLFAVSIQRLQKQNNLVKMVPDFDLNRQLQNPKASSCSNKCFPYLFETSKRCVVCKQSKPKYGCRQCSLRYKREIHLCVSGCFKLFHLETIKYISNQLSIIGVSPSLIDTSTPPFIRNTSSCFASTNNTLAFVPSDKNLKNQSTKEVLSLESMYKKFIDQQIIDDKSQLSISQNKQIEEVKLQGYRDRRLRRKQIKKVAKCISKEKFLSEKPFNHIEIYQLAGSLSETKQQIAPQKIEMDIEHQQLR